MFGGKKTKKVEVRYRLLKGTQFPFLAMEFECGPFSWLSDSRMKVCLTESKQKGAHLHLPIPDYSVPPDEGKFKEVLGTIIRMSSTGTSVGFGCAGGIGRTGLMLGALHKVGGSPDPLEDLKAYHPGSPETAAQRRWIENLDVFDVRSSLNWAWRR